MRIVLLGLLVMLSGCCTNSDKRIFDVPVHVDNWTDTTKPGYYVEDTPMQFHGSCDIKKAQLWSMDSSIRLIPYSVESINGMFYAISHKKSKGNDILISYQQQHGTYVDAIIFRAFKTIEIVWSKDNQKPKGSEAKQ